MCSRLSGLYFLIMRWVFIICTLQTITTSMSAHNESNGRPQITISEKPVLDKEAGKYQKAKCNRQQKILLIQKKCHVVIFICSSAGQFSSNMHSDLRIRIDLNNQFEVWNLYKIACKHSNLNTGSNSMCFFSLWLFVRSTTTRQSVTSGNKRAIVGSK